MPRRRRYSDQRAIDRWLLTQDNARGMGLARDVKAGQAYETSLSVRRKWERKTARKTAQRRYQA